MSEPQKEKLEIKGDERGDFIEIFKVPGKGQTSYSTTKPGITRGNHYHTRKEESFCVIEGEAKIRLRNINTNEMKEFDVSGENPETVKIPPNWTHNITNTGDKEMVLLMWISEVFNPEDPDTFYEEV
jgi:UDP-2-acetamido-2,6-beta-L-arabino-hexul-4-ose reductase